MTIQGNPAILATVLAGAVALLTLWLWIGLRRKPQPNRPRHVTQARETLNRTHSQPNLQTAPSGRKQAPDRHKHSPQNAGSLRVSNSNDSDGPISTLFCTVLDAPDKGKPLSEGS